MDIIGLIFVIWLACYMAGRSLEWLFATVALLHFGGAGLAVISGVMSLVGFTISGGLAYYAFSHISIFIK